jgi:hypothetical protein
MAFVVAVHGYDIGPVQIGIALPSRRSLYQLEVACGAEFVVFGQPQGIATILELKAGDQQTLRLKVSYSVVDDCRTIGRTAVDHHIARHRHDVEVPVETHRRQVGMHPTDRRIRASSELQQIVIEIDANDVDATSGQFDRHTTHSTAGIEHAGRMKRLDEVSLAVGRLSGRFELTPPREVLLQIGDSSPLRPATAHAVHIVRTHRHSLTALCEPGQLPRQSSGQIFAATLPSTSSTATGPNVRESIELARLSPSTKTRPGGTTSGPKKKPCIPRLST